MCCSSRNRRGQSHRFWMTARRCCRARRTTGETGVCAGAETAYMCGRTQLPSNWATVATAGSALSLTASWQQCTRPGVPKEEALTLQVRKSLYRHQPMSLNSGYMISAVRIHPLWVFYTTTSQVFVETWLNILIRQFLTKLKLENIF